MMDPLQRAKLAHELSAKVREVSALPARTAGEDEGPLLLKRIRLVKEVNDLLARLFGDPGDGPYAEAHAYFKQNMQGKTVQTAAGPVLISGASWKEMKRGMKSDGLKAALIPYVIEILTAGTYGGRESLNKDRTDPFLAFHFFKKTVEVMGLSVTAGVNVGERVDGSLVYGLGHEFEARWAKRKGAEESRGQEPRGSAPSKDVSALDAIMSNTGWKCNKKLVPLLSSGKEPEVESGSGDVSAALDSVFDEDGAGVNIIILSVIDKNGDHVPELEDGVVLDAVGSQIELVRKAQVIYGGLRSGR